MAEADITQDGSEVENNVTDAPQEPSEPLAKFVIPGQN